MGVDLCTYRARIGCFRNPAFGPLCCWQSCLLVWMVISQLMLKLAGDVEENPGPSQQFKNKVKPKEWDMMGKRTLLTLDLSCKYDFSTGSSINPLAQLPEEVFELKELEALDLTNNENIDLSDQLTRLDYLKLLCLDRCNLDTVPAAVMKLPQLEMLILSDNWNITLPDDMSGLINLTVLVLDSCNLDTLPPVVLKLSNLQVLDISADRNSILKISLPDALPKLNKLKVLRLRFGNLDTVPPAVLKLPQLEELDLSWNSGIRLPDGLTGLTNLRVLKLAGTGMKTVPPVVWRLTQLEWLDLSGNQLQTLPAEIGQLASVKHLGLCLCKLRTLPPEVGGMIQLEWLDLSRNQLQMIPRKIGQLTNVKHLDLSDCELRTLPPEVGRLTQLKRLNLSHNKLQTLPAEVGQFSSACRLDVIGNPLIKPPAEVCRQGIDAIRQYFDELERSEEAVSAHLKVVVLGETMAGKTSLVQTLNSGKSTLTEEEDRTHCVEITQWAPTDNITFEVYDFGGHDMYHLTHQLFLTQGALNLLTVNLQEYRCSEECYTQAVGFWLDTLNARVPGAVVTIVGSKMDLCSSTEIEKKTKDIQERFTQQHAFWQRTIQQQIDKLQGSANGGTDRGEIAQQIERTRQLLTRPLRLTGVHCVSSAEPSSGLDSLVAHIMDTTNNTDLFPTLRRILPKTWVEFERLLRNLRDKGTEEHQSAESTSYGETQTTHSNDLKWLTREECLQQGQLAGLTADRLESVLSYLQQVGTILRYTDIPELKDLIFHDPSGLIDVMKELFHHDLMKVFKNTNPRLKDFSNTKLKKVRKNLSSRGFLPREVVIGLLGPHARPVGNVDVITNLMEHFGLCYTERPRETSVPVGYYIPWYIQEERPEAINRDVTGQESTVTCELTHFCPRGLFERLSVVVNKLIKTRQDWKDVIVAVRDSLPVIVYREMKHEHVNIVVKLTVQAVQGTEMIWAVIDPLKDKLSALLKEWPGLLYRLVYSTFTQQGYQQLLACSPNIPTFPVGPRGCTVQHSGVTLEFPAGCVRSTRFISVEVEAVPVNEDVRTMFTAFSAVLTVEQDFPQRFLRPVTVSLPWVWTQTGQKDEETRTVVLHYDRDEGWTVFPTKTHEEDGPRLPIILLINDEYGTSKGGISTINCQASQILQDKAVVYATVLQLNVPKEDQEAADRDGVKLIKPVQIDKESVPTLDWLTKYHSVHFPDLPKDVTCIIGHADITDMATHNIHNEYYKDQADLIMFTHVIPEDTEYYKGGRKAMKARDKEKDMLDKVDNAKAVFSVGKRIYDHCSTKYKGEKKPQNHHIFLPKPSKIFLDADVSPGGGEKVVLSIGRVRNVEKLKGHDLAGQSLREVIKIIKNARWCVRGISEDDFETSQKILEDALNSPDLNPTLLPYGTQEDIRDDMTMAHLVLMPSRSEPFGLVGLEAIAAGIPVLISDKTGLAEMITDLIDQGKLSAEHRHVIVETSVNDRDRAGDAKRWADRIVDILEHNDAEFEKAARFKRELVASRYWEESHNAFLQACGITAAEADQ
ncbi:PREDICTED: malignant fibrous histiocytoma-amplified sequence 1 homolog [Branchiostoma belcheri]|uniref:Malignant fibrous histiocytoma-amplified sequence 1 homolog n=1 Tax=Branchiostoma belcheri TaxID=7741 RepID=A0A6P4Y5Y3_BRABE|nr:PREDICTED: malignant fibrous histiocytoma-amplified sequence 1 homolog [Branchiostoma belcheri]